MPRLRLIALLLLALAGCGGDSSGDALHNANSKIVFPGISSASVAEGETAVSIRPNIVITFTEEMDRSSVEQNLKFERAGYGQVSNIVKNWFDNDRTLALSAGSDLELNNIYLIEISADAMSKAGYKMQNGFSTYFTTSHVDNVPPEVIGTSPEDGAVNVSGGQNIVVYFSKDMNKAATEAAFSLKDSAGQSVSGTFSWAGSNMIFTPGEKLSPFGKYSINVGGSAADFMGNNSTLIFKTDFTVYGRYIPNRSIGDYSKYFLSQANDVAVFEKDGEKYLFIISIGNHKISKFRLNRIPGQPDSSYLYINSWDSPGYNLTVDSLGNVYVANEAEIIKYDFTGNFIKRWNTNVTYVYMNIMGIECFNNQIFLVDFNKMKINKFDSDGNLITSYDVPFRPFDIKIATNNKIYISGISNIGIYDLSFNVIKSITLPYWYALISIEVDNNNIYCSESNGRLFKYDNSGEHIYTLTINKSGGMYIASDNILYLASGSSLTMYTSEGNYITSWGDEGSSNQQFSSIKELSFNSNYDSLYVIDSSLWKIVKLSINGDYLANTSLYPYLQEGTGIAIDNNDNIYTCSRFVDNLYKYNYNITLIETYNVHRGNSIDIDRFDNIYQSFECGIRKYNKSLDKIWEKSINNVPFKTIAVDSNCNVYGLEYLNPPYRVRKLDSDGNFIKFIAQGNLSYPGSIAIDHNDKLYIADNNKIKIYTSDGQLLHQFDTYIPDEDRYYTAAGIAIHQNGEIYTSADTRIITYTLVSD